MLFILLACHESCADSCTGGSPKDCEKCKEGWEITEEDGCKGISIKINTLAPVSIACSCHVLCCRNYFNYCVCG